MTIYILDQDPTLSAQYLDDKSLDKQIKDIAQVLYIVHGRIKFISAGIDTWSKWTSQCKANYLWMVRYGIECTNEFSYRFKKYAVFDLGNEKVKYPYDGSYHKYHNIIMWARDNMPELPRIHADGAICADRECKEDCPATPFPLLMPKRYIDFVSSNMNHAIPSYRTYYQAKLRQRIQRCPGCMHEQQHGIPDPYCDNVRWTKRSQPEWVRL